MLAVVCGDSYIRMFALDDDDSVSLSLTDSRFGGAIAAKDTAICVAWNPRKRTLATGTSSGRVVMWTHTGTPQQQGQCVARVFFGVVVDESQY